MSKDTDRYLELEAQLSTIDDTWDDRAHELVELGTNLTEEDWKELAQHSPPDTMIPPEYMEKMNGLVLEKLVEVAALAAKAVKAGVDVKLPN